MISVVLATTLAGILSLTAAAVISLALWPGIVERLVSLSVGLMLATSLLHSLPEAFESGANARSLLATILSGLFVFFLLEKTTLLRHPQASTDGGHSHHHPGKGARSGWMILIGDGMHNFSDGILIAAAFLANPKLGLVTGLAIIAHEIPQRIGDFLVLLNKGCTRTRAVLLSLPFTLLAVAGGLAGTFALERASGLVPYVLAFSASGFLYIALSDLMPRMQRGATWRGTVLQVLLIGLGIGIVLCLTDHRPAAPQQVQLDLGKQL